MANAMSELDRLIEAVEAGTATTMLFEDALGAAIPSADGWAELAYHGSLDAAKALHEGLLGKGCHFNLMEDEDAGGYHAEVYLNDWRHGGSSDPARAWLLTILRAYRDSNQAEGAR
ncbi:hypothetical protein D2T29_12535 [Sinirhodobacter populi]|uniref:Uncharacterized protein n=1 Tax=Paenirhodobacter populi TaxID=2306993 RepID=A0A443KCG2_9RHOB|nr:hypothetical protein [Sinirhodobacter populi]RWR30491.1 hypothetical protein D2T29_12535 [Sinirhodobacter populi]